MVGSIPPVILFCVSILREGARIFTVHSYFITEIDSTNNILYNLLLGFHQEKYLITSLSADPGQLWVTIIHQFLKYLPPGHCQEEVMGYFSALFPLISTQNSYMFCHQDLWLALRGSVQCQTLLQTRKLIYFNIFSLKYISKIERISFSIYSAGQISYTKRFKNGHFYSPSNVLLFPVELEQWALLESPPPSLPLLWCHMKGSVPHVSK